MVTSFNDEDWKNTNITQENRFHKKKKTSQNILTSPQNSTNSFGNKLL